MLLLLRKRKRNDPSILYAAGRRTHSRVSLLCIADRRARTGRHTLLEGAVIAGPRSARVAIARGGRDHHVLMLLDAVSRDQAVGI